MKISIITPSYNYGRYLGEAIESIARQNYPDVEHIVVDGQSTDDTLEVLQRYAHLPHLKWVSEPDEGQTDAINKGFRMATGDVVAWLNADEYYLEGTLDKVRRAFEERPEADVVYGDVRYVAQDGTPIRDKRDHPFDHGVLLYYGCYIISAATFFRRRIVEHNHLLDPSFKVTMDYEYFVRLADLGYRFAYLPEVLAAFRWHDGNISSRYLQRRREERLKVQHQYGFRITHNYALQTYLYDVAARLYKVKRQVLKYGSSRTGVRL